jgi:pheromone shutdown protein TraB
VHIVSVQGREFILVGTAHVAQESTDLVREVLGKEKPDYVCVELDAQRYMALSQQQRWEDLDWACSHFSGQVPSSARCEGAIRFNLFHRPASE